VLLPFAVVLLVVLAAPVSAQHYTQEELHSLPRVCLAQRVIHHSLHPPVVPDAERAELAQRLGPDYRHFHHYCWALIDLNRASHTRTKTARDGAYSSAIRNFEYVQINATSDFPLMPEVNLRKGMTLQQIGDHVGAAREFLGAIQIKRDYTPAYSALIDLYIDLREYGEANRVLQSGLAVAPDSKILATKKTEVDAHLAAQR
jgi:hypothetical protein